MANQEDRLARIPPALRRSRSVGRISEAGVPIAINDDFMSDGEDDEVAWMQRPTAMAATPLNDEELANFTMMLERHYPELPLPRLHMHLRMFMLQSRRRHLLSEKNTPKMSADGCLLRGCTVCKRRNALFQAHQAQPFVPHTLKQRLLLEWGYKFAAKKLDDQIHTLPIPEIVQAEISNVGQQVKNREIPIRARFSLVAAACLEAAVVDIWNQLGAHDRTELQAMIGEGDSTSGNPLISYWVCRCTNQVVRGHMLELPAFYFAVAHARMDSELNYLWTRLSERLGSDQLCYALDHGFHKAVEAGNKDAVVYLWERASAAQHDSMISAAVCCSTKNAYYSFELAVVHGNFDIVHFLWTHTSPAQHNGMLLAEHCKAFCTAADLGFYAIVQLLWRDTTKNQRFLLLFEQNGLAFRSACAKGHTEIVRLLWSFVSSPHEKCQLLSLANGDAICQATRNGYVDVLQSLFDEDDGELIEHVHNTLFGSVLTAAVQSRATASLDFWLAIGTPKPCRIARALLSNDGEACKAVVKEGFQYACDRFQTMLIETNMLEVARTKLDDAVFEGIMGFAHAGATRESQTAECEAIGDELAGRSHAVFHVTDRPVFDEILRKIEDAL